MHRPMSNKLKARSIKEGGKRKWAIPKMPNACKISAYCSAWRRLVYQSPERQSLRSCASVPASITMRMKRQWCSSTRSPCLKWRRVAPWHAPTQSCAVLLPAVAPCGPWHCCRLRQVPRFHDSFAQRLTLVPSATKPPLRRDAQVGQVRRTNGKDRQHYCISCFGEFGPR